LFHQPAPVGDFFCTLLRLSSAIAGFLTGSLTVTPHVLLYATGGGAWVRGNVDVLEPENAILSATARPTRSGWVAGVGAEILMQDGWSMFMSATTWASAGARRFSPASNSPQSLRSRSTFAERAGGHARDQSAVQRPLIRPIAKVTPPPIGAAGCGRPR
jgi:hypothetical protein